DFSDSVTSISDPFASIRQRAAQRQLVVLRPDSKVMSLPAMDKSASPPEGIAAVEKMLPSTAQRNVAAAAETNWTLANAPSIQAAGQAIPFFGILMGFASIGHAVWIFKPANVGVLTIGARDADVLIVDSA